MVLREHEKANVWRVREASLLTYSYQYHLSIAYIFLNHNLNISKLEYYKPLMIPRQINVQVNAIQQTIFYHNIFQEFYFCLNKVY